MLSSSDINFSSAADITRDFGYVDNDAQFLARWANLHGFVSLLLARGRYCGAERAIR